jgi:hypothetical protein
VGDGPAATCMTGRRRQLRTAGVTSGRTGECAGLPWRVPPVGLYGVGPSCASRSPTSLRTSFVTAFLADDLLADPSAGGRPLCLLTGRARGGRRLADRRQTDREVAAARDGMTMSSGSSMWASGSTTVTTPDP